jgi:diguanylate cyclase (GGDEF)-like protein
LRRLYLSMNLLAVLGLLGFAGHNWAGHHVDARAALASVSHLSTRVCALHIDHQLDRLRALGERLVGAEALSAPASVQPLLDRALAQNPVTVAYLLSRPDGRRLLSAGPSEAAALLTPGARRTSVAPSSPPLTESSAEFGRPERLAGRWVMPVRVAIEDAQGRIVAIMSAAQAMTGAGSMAAALELPEPMRFALMREDGYPQFVHPLDPEHDRVYAEVAEQAGLITAAGTQDYLDVVMLGEPSLAVAEPLGRFGLTAVTYTPSHSLRYHWALHMLAPTLLVLLFAGLSTVALRWVRTSERAYEDRLAHQSQHDLLTGLPKRALMLDRLGQGLRTADFRRLKVGLMVLRIDQYARVKERYGHDLADELLRRMAGRLKFALAPGDTVARVAGNELVVILPGIASAAIAEKVGLRLLRVVQQPMPMAGISMLITLTIGVAVAPDDATSEKELLNKASLALIKAMHSGSNRIAFFTGELDRQVRRRTLVEDALGNALEGRQLEVHYQPQYAARAPEQGPVGVEALVRWRSPQLGWVSPDEFIPIAEDMGLVREIDDFVMHEAMRLVARVESRSGRPLRLSVNVSARALMDEDLPARVQRALSLTGFVPERLVLEITETAVLVDFERAARAVRALRDLGLGVAVDDFGTGYSSLVYLSRLNVSEIKIDRSFVREMFEDESREALTRSIIAMGRAQGLHVVAEGVETKAQHSALVGYGCDSLQGYLLARPMPAEELLALLQSDAPGPAALAGWSSYPPIRGVGRGS